MLRKVYLHHKIRKRVISKRLFLLESAKQNREEERERVFPIVLDLFKRGKCTFLWADEACFTKGEFSAVKVYSKQGSEF